MPPVKAPVFGSSTVPVVPATPQARRLLLGSEAFTLSAISPVANYSSVRAFPLLKAWNAGSSVLQNPQNLKVPSANDSKYLNPYLGKLRLTLSTKRDIPWLEPLIQEVAQALLRVQDWLKARPELKVPFGLRDAQRVAAHLDLVLHARMSDGEIADAVIRAFELVFQPIWTEPGDNSESDLMLRDTLGNIRWSPSGVFRNRTNIGNWNPTRRALEYRVAMDCAVHRLSKLVGKPFQKIPAVEALKNNPKLVLVDSTVKALGYAADAFCINRTVMFTGPSGIGKSVELRALADALGWGTVEATAHRGMTEEDLLQSLGVRTNRKDGKTEFVFRDGPLLRAIREKKLLILNELHLMRSKRVVELMKYLDMTNQKIRYFDPDKKGFVELEIPEQFRIAVTRNPWGGAMNGALKNRMMEFVLPELRDEEQRFILKQSFLKAVPGEPDWFLTRAEFDWIFDRYRLLPPNSGDAKDKVWNLRHFLRAGKLLESYDDITEEGAPSPVREIFYDVFLCGMEQNTRRLISSTDDFKHVEERLSALTLDQVCAEFSLPLEKAQALAKKHGVLDFPTSARVLRHILVALTQGESAWLQGPAGTGKTTLARLAGELLGEVFEDVLKPDTDAAQLKGQLRPVTKKIGRKKILGYENVPSVLVQGLRRAKELQVTGQLVTVILDEAALARPEVLEEINDGKLWIVNEAGEWEELIFPENFRLVLASNRYGYRQVRRHRPSLYSRFWQIDVGFEFTEQELGQVMVAKSAGKIDAALGEELGRVVRELHDYFDKRPEAGRVVSLRDAEWIAEYVAEHLPLDATPEQRVEVVARAFGRLFQPEFACLDLQRPEDRAFLEILKSLKIPEAKVGEYLEQKQLEREIRQELRSGKKLEEILKRRNLLAGEIAIHHPSFKSILDLVKDLKNPENIKQLFVEIEDFDLDVGRGIILSIIATQEDVEVLLQLQPVLSELIEENFFLNGGKDLELELTLIEKIQELAPKLHLGVEDILGKKGDFKIHARIAELFLRTQAEISLDLVKKARARLVATMPRDTTSVGYRYARNLFYQLGVKFNLLSQDAEVAERRALYLDPKIDALVPNVTILGCLNTAYAELLQLEKEPQLSKDEADQVRGRMDANIAEFILRLELDLGSIDEDDWKFAGKILSLAMRASGNLEAQIQNLQNLFEGMRYGNYWNYYVAKNIQSWIPRIAELIPSKFLGFLSRIQKKILDHVDSGSVMSDIGEQTVDLVRVFYQFKKNLKIDALNQQDQATLCELESDLILKNLSKALSLCSRGKRDKLLAPLLLEHGAEIEKLQNENEASQKKIEALSQEFLLVDPGSAQDLQLINGLQKLGEKLGLRTTQDALQSGLDGSDFEFRLASLHESATAIAEVLFSRRAMLLNGPPASGKSDLMRQLARVLGWRVTEVTGHRELSEPELFQQIGVRLQRHGAGVPVITEGPLARALMRGDLFLLNEIHLMKGDRSVELIKYLSQNNRTFQYFNPETGRVETRDVAPGFRFVATRNPEGEPLNEALKNRMTEIEFKAYTKEEMKRIVARYFPQCSREYLSDFVEDFFQLIELTPQLKAHPEGYEWTLRHLLRFLNFATRNGDLSSIEMFDAVWGAGMPMADREKFFQDFTALPEHFESLKKVDFAKVAACTGVDLEHLKLKARRLRVLDLPTTSRALRDILVALQNGDSLWLKGPAGTSKTTLARLAGKLLGVVYEDTLKPGTTAAELKSQIRPYQATVNGKKVLAFKNLPAPLLKGLRKAKQFAKEGRAELVTILLDEAAFARPEVRESLNDRRIWVVNRAGQIEELVFPENVRLVCASNDYGYSQVQKSSSAERSRFWEIYLGFDFSAQELSQVIRRSSRNRIDVETAECLGNILRELHPIFAQNPELEHVVSLRDAERIGKHLADFLPKDATPEQRTQEVVDVLALVYQGILEGFQFEKEAQGQIVKVIAEAYFPGGQFQQQFYAKLFETNPLGMLQEHGDLVGGLAAKLVWRNPFPSLTSEEEKKHLEAESLWREVNPDKFQARVRILIQEKRLDKFFLERVLSKIQDSELLKVLLRELREASSTLSPNIVDLMVLAMHRQAELNGTVDAPTLSFLQSNQRGNINSWARLALGKLLLKSRPTTISLEHFCFLLRQLEELFFSTVPELVLHRFEAFLELKELRGAFLSDGQSGILNGIFFRQNLHQLDALVKERAAQSLEHFTSRDQLSHILLEPSRPAYAFLARVSPQEFMQALEIKLQDEKFPEKDFLVFAEIALTYFKGDGADFKEWGVRIRAFIAKKLRRFSNSPELHSFIFKHGDTFPEYSKYREEFWARHQALKQMTLQDALEFSEESPAYAKLLQRMRHFAGKIRLDASQDSLQKHWARSPFDIRLQSVQTLAVQAVEALSISRALLVTGPAAAGKSELLRQLAEAIGWPYLEINGHPDLGKEALMQQLGVGFREEEGGLRIFFRDGPLLQALRDGKLLILNEIHRMRGKHAVELMKFLAGNETHFDYYDGETGQYRKVRIARGFRLAATRNPWGTPLNAALKDRMIEIKAKEHNDFELQRILEREFALESHDVEQLVVLYRALIVRTKTASLATHPESYEWNLRHLQRAARLLKEARREFGASLTPEALLGVFDDSWGLGMPEKDREQLFQALEKRDFGVKIAPEDIQRHQEKQRQLTFAQVFEEMGITDLAHAKRLADHFGIVDVPLSARILRGLLQALACGDPVWMKGAPGLGKTLLARYAGLLRGRVYEDVLKPGTDAAQLKGQLRPVYRVVNGERVLGFENVPSKLVEALEKSWELEGTDELSTAILDEAMFASPEVMEEFNTLLDRGKAIWVVDAQGQWKPLRRGRNFRLVLASNDYGDVELQKQSPAFRSRFFEVYCEPNFDAPSLGKLFQQWMKPKTAWQGRNLAARYGTVTRAHTASDILAQWDPQGQFTRMSAPVQGGIQKLSADHVDPEDWRKFLQVRDRILGNAAEMARRSDLEVVLVRGIGTAAYTLGKGPAKVLLDVDFLRKKSVRFLECVVGLHEGGHGDIDGIGSGFFFQSEKYRAIFNVLADLRVNDRVESRNSGIAAEYREELESFYTQDGPAPARHPHQAFLNAIIDKAYNRNFDENQLDPQVREAVNAVWAEVEKIKKLHPKSANPKDSERDAFIHRFEEAIKKHVLPTYELLYKESVQQVSQKIVAGEEATGSGGDGTIDPKDLSEEAKKILEAGDEAIADRYAPKGTRGEQQKAARKKADQEPKASDAKHDEGEGKNPSDAPASKDAPPSSTPSPTKNIEQVAEDRRQAATQRKEDFTDKPFQQLLDTYGPAREEFYQTFHQGLPPNEEGDEGEPQRMGQVPDMMRLIKAMHGLSPDFRIFRGKGDLTERMYRLRFMLDCSGSMRDPAVQEGALGLTAIFMDCFDRMGFGFGMDGFHREYFELKPFDKRIALDSEKANEFFRNLLKYHFGMGSTNILLGLNRGIEKIREAQRWEFRSDNYFFVATDGEITEQEGEEIRRLDDQVEKEGIIFVGAGIGEGMEAVAKYFKRHIIAPNPRKLPEAAAGFLRRGVRRVV